MSYTCYNKPSKYQCDFGKTLNSCYDMSYQQGVDALEYAKKHCTKDISPSECVAKTAYHLNLPHNGSLGDNSYCYDPDLCVKNNGRENFEYYSLDNAYGNWKEKYGGTGISISAAIKGPACCPNYITSEPELNEGYSQSETENFGAFSLRGALTCGACKGGGAVKYIEGVF